MSLTIQILRKQIGTISLTNRQLNNILNNINTGKENWASFDKNGWYQISSNGRIRSINRVINDGRNRKERFLMPQLNRYGYITIYIRSLNKNFLQHRLIGQAFKPNPKNKAQINHINGIKDDNRLINIEWSTEKENRDHSFDTGLRAKTPKGKKNKLFGKNNNHFSKKIAQIGIETGEIIKIWPSAHEAKRVLGVNNKSISQCALGKRPTSNGYKWKYV